MLIRIEVVHQADALYQEAWSFNYLDHALVLVGWRKEVRQTKRHKFQAVEFFDVYSRDSRDDSNVPLPDEVRKEAMQKFMDGLKIGKWSELRGNR